MKIPSLSHVRQWADYQITSEPVQNTVLEAVAHFVLLSLDSPELPADTLIAIQRSFEPLDDAGTLRMQVDRATVVKLLQEVLRLRANAISPKATPSSAAVAPVAIEKPEIPKEEPVASPPLTTVDQKTAAKSTPRK